MNDAAVTNPDMNRNYDSYPVETLEVPTVIFYAKDDKLSPYDAAVTQFPQCTCSIFEEGGHLGHGEEIRRALTEFVIVN